jgi:hypothetical protein
MIQETMNPIESNKLKQIQGASGQSDLVAGFQ